MLAKVRATLHSVVGIESDPAQSASQLLPLPLRVSGKRADNLRGGGLRLITTTADIDIDTLSRQSLPATRTGDLSGGPLAQERVPLPFDGFLTLALLRNQPETVAHL